MTLLTKPVTLRVALFLDNRVTPRGKDLVAITLYPNEIGFRPYHCRKEIKISLSTVYRQAIISCAKDMERQRQEEAKALGKRIRKPRRFSALK
jgi:hypothetical protein